MSLKALIAGFIPDDFGEYRISVSIPNTDLSLADMRHITAKIKSELPGRDSAHLRTVTNGEHYCIFSLRIWHNPGEKKYMPRGLLFCDAVRKVLKRPVIIDKTSIPKP